MYENYWQLNCKPFINTADPKFYYPSREHEEALSKLAYAVNENLGAAMLTGPHGSGKTMLTRVLLERGGSRNRGVLCLAQPESTPLDLLRALARGMTGAALSSLRSELVVDVLVEAIEKGLATNVREGRHTVVVLDEAQVITSQSVLETTRLLLNFQRAEGFLLTLLLVGHSELAGRLVNMTELVQWIPVTCALVPFDAEDTAQYVQARLAAAGSQRRIFSETALRAIHEGAGGIPRRINTLCEASLAVGCAQKAAEIDAPLVQQAALKFGVA